MARPARPSAGGEGEDAQADTSRRTRTDLIVIAVVAALVIGGIWLTHVIADMRKVQDCVLSGRTNCVPIEMR